MGPGFLTFSSEPPCIEAQAPIPADLRSAGHLADPDLLAAAVGQMKDIMAIGEAQRRTDPPGLSSQPQRGSPLGEARAGQI